MYVWQSEQVGSFFSSEKFDSFAEIICDDFKEEEILRNWDFNEKMFVFFSTTLDMFARK